jgi:hypothetical protein
MRRTKAAQAERREYWRKLIALQEQSRQPVRVFCKEHRVGENSFYAWRHRLERQPPVENPPMRFALVEPAGADHARPILEMLELTLATGECLRIAEGVDAVTLRTVLAVLREPHA